MERSDEGVHATFKLSPKLLKFISETDYSIIQSNGQRILRLNPTSEISPPPKGTEIFVGNLPHNLFEDELVPIFRNSGPIYNVRIMVDFFGRNRGFAFISYFRPEDAYAAVKTYDHYKLRSRTSLAVCLSVDNRRLFVGNIARNQTVQEIQTTLAQYVEGIVEVIIYQEPHKPALNRGFAFVEFESHRLAAIARRQLAPSNLMLWGQTIFVDWAEPLPVVSPEILQNVTKLYLSNMPYDLTTKELLTILGDVLKSGCSNILKVHKTQHYAFVHFTLRVHAEEALEELQGLYIMGHKLRINWARPIEYSKRHRPQDVLPNHCCRSVPPSIRNQVQKSLALRHQIKSRLRSSTLSTDFSSFSDIGYFSSAAN